MRRGWKKGKVVAIAFEARQGSKREQAKRREGTVARFGAVVTEQQERTSRYMAPGRPALPCLVPSCAQRQAR
jgi:hypothetical protein